MELVKKRVVFQAWREESRAPPRIFTGFDEGWYRARSDNPQTISTLCWMSRILDSDSEWGEGAERQNHGLGQDCEWRKSQCSCGDSDAGDDILLNSFSSNWKYLTASQWTKKKPPTYVDCIRISNKSSNFCWRGSEECLFQHLLFIFFCIKDVLKSTLLLIWL